MIVDDEPGWSPEELEAEVARASAENIWPAADLLAFHAAYRSGVYTDPSKLFAVVIDGRDKGQYKTLEACKDAEEDGQTMPTSVFSLKGLITSDPPRPSIIVRTAAPTPGARDLSPRVMASLHAEHTLAAWGEKSAPLQASEAAIAVYDTGATRTVLQEAIPASLKVSKGKLRFRRGTVRGAFDNAPAVSVRIVSPRKPGHLQFSVALNGVAPVPVDDFIVSGAVTENIVGMDVISRHQTTVGPGSHVHVALPESAASLARNDKPHKTCCVVM